MSDTQKEFVLDVLESFSKDIRLAEVIEHGPQWFRKIDPYHLESNLLESFDSKEFKNLGLHRYFPKMYRGLPRQYLKNDPKICHIKKGYTDLFAIKKRAISKAIFSRYQNVNVSGKLVVISKIGVESLGDYYLSLELVRLLKKRFSHLTLHFIFIVPQNFSNFLQRLDEGIYLEYDSFDSVSIFTKDAIDILDGCDLLLQIPNFYSHTADLLKLLKKAPKLELILEDCNIELKDLKTRVNSHSLGFHFLDKGIFLQKVKEVSWDDVKNQKILDWKEDSHHFYFAYLNDKKSGQIYLHALLKSLEFDDKAIDLCLPTLDWFIELIEENKGSPVETDLNIGSIEICFQNFFTTIPVSQRGKKLRILAPGYLSHKDFQTLLVLSNPFVAIKGLQSFSEAVSCGKIFFYEAKEKALFLMKDLLAFAEYHLKDYPNAISYLRALNDAFLLQVSDKQSNFVDESYFQEKQDWKKIAYSMGKCLQDPNLQKGFEILSQKIRMEFCINDYICHLVQRSLFHSKYPEMEKNEKILTDEFLSSEISFSNLVQSIDQLIQDCKEMENS